MFTKEESAEHLPKKKASAILMEDSLSSKVLNFSPNFLSYSFTIFDGRM